ncbi:MAG: dienelactone hydrolase [Actinomycetia bacterium]|nr:dienelactone hydrolase [Actinomycetes bacterium]
MATTHNGVLIRAADVDLQADVDVPEHLRGLVMFAPGSGTNRLSPRNRSVADQLLSAGPGTVLVYLFTPREERFDGLTAELRFDIEVLATRLIVVVMIRLSSSSTAARWSHPWRSVT